MKLHSAHHRHSRAIALVGVLVIIGLLSMISLLLHCLGLPAIISLSRRSWGRPG